MLHNADVQQHEDPESIKQALVRQLFSPVRWTEIIRSFADAGITYVVECGPGKILSGLKQAHLDKFAEPGTDGRRGDPKRAQHINAERVIRWVLLREVLSVSVLARNRSIGD